MRKWMRERLKRRKTKPEEQPKATDSSQAPLQPDLYDTGEPPPSLRTQGLGPEAASEEPEPQPELERPRATSSQPEAARQPTPRDGQSRRRRRRGRGGRGRRGAASPQQPTPAPMPALSPALERSGAPSAAPTAEAAKPPLPQPPQGPKGVVVLAIGLPGSGKSSWFKRHNITPLSSDMLRSLLFDDPTEQRFQDLVFSNLRSMLKARLIARRPMNYLDATNLSPHERHTWIKMARDYGYEVHAVFFDVPIEVCLERNQRRQRMVPENVMRRLASKLRPPTFEEGITKITIVRVKKKE